MKKDIRFRVYITFTCMFVLGCAIIARAVYIQVKQGPELRSMAREMHTRFETLEAERGNILNEEGRPLSTSIPEFDVHIDFSVIDTALFADQIDSLSRCMAILFVNKGKSAEDYKEEFVQAYDNGNKYYPLGRKLKYYEYEALRNFPIFIKGKSGGFIAEPKEKRRLPYGEFARRTLGIFRDSNINGLEAKYNKELAGENGRRVVQKAAGGLWVPVDGSEAEPVNGKDIVTTLDMDVQAVAHDALLSNLRKYQCLYGTCIVMEVATGKIRTLVNLGRQKDSTYTEDFNYATIPTEPGSTFKLMTLTALLNDKYINVDSIVDIQGGRRQFANRVMEDSHPNPSLGPMPIWKAYAISSNVGMAKLADRYYHDQPQKYVDHLKRLHLDKYTGIDLLGERKAKVMEPSGKQWSKTSLPWMAIGYGVLITPLHTCMLYNAVANNGKMMKPYLVSAIREYGKDVKTIEPEVVATLGDEEVVRQLRKCTRAVVVEGTGKDIASPYYSMSGKTGTAQVADKGIKYTDGVYQGSYVGYMPAENPKYTICIVIRTKPHSSAYYGGTIAAPVFRMVADKIFSRNMGAWTTPLDSMAKTGSAALPAKAATASAYEILLGAMHKKMPIPVEQRNLMVQAVTDTTKRTHVQEKVVYKGIMPDVTGMTLKDAVYMLENYGVHVQLAGKGKVIAQSVPVGTRLQKGQSITLQLG
ncbi:penicillin-binding protein [Nemorincola caseinilytica]|uniref:penicillin-binding protein n=1 Tax=Nemorincola caseinilytica TaxID=2054315 RepID=UPI0031EBD3E9